MRFGDVATLPFGVLEAVTAASLRLRFSDVVSLRFGDVVALLFGDALDDMLASHLALIELLTLSNEGGVSVAALVALDLLFALASTETRKCFGEERVVAPTFAFSIKRGGPMASLLAPVASSFIGDRH